MSHLLRPSFTQKLESQEGFSQWAKTTGQSRSGVQAALLGFSMRPELDSKEVVQPSATTPKVGAVVSALGKELKQDAKPPPWGQVQSRRGAGRQGRAAFHAIARKDSRQRDKRREETPGQPWGAQARQQESRCRGSVAKACLMCEQGRTEEQPRASGMQVWDEKRHQTTREGNKSLF